MAQSPPQEIVSSSENSPGRYLKISPHSHPCFSIPGGLLPTNGEIASGYLESGRRPIPLILDRLKVILLSEGLPGVEK